MTNRFPDENIRDRREFYATNFINENIHIMETMAGIGQWFDFHDKLAKIAPNKAKRIYSLMEDSYQKKNDYIDGKIPFSEYEDTVHNWFYLSMIYHEGMPNETKKIHGFIC